MHRAVRVAAGDAIGAGEILHRIGHIGIGIEQTGGVAAIAEPACGVEPDLHEPVIALADSARIAAALALDDPANQLLRDIVGCGMLGDERIKIAVGVDHGDAFFRAGERRASKRNHDRGEAETASHVSSTFKG